MPSTPSHYRGHDAFILKNSNHPTPELGISKWPSAHPVVDQSDEAHMPAFVDVP